MIRPDFRDYKNAGNELMHSAKGTTWNIHKYISKERKGGATRYIYPTVGRRLKRLTSGLPSTTQLGYMVGMASANALQDLKRDMSNKDLEYQKAKDRADSIKRSKTSSSAGIAKAAKDVQAAKDAYEKAKEKYDAMERQQRIAEKARQIGEEQKAERVKGKVASTISKNLTKGWYKAYNRR